MQPEIEATFLELDLADVRARLTALGATCREPQHTMKRSIFDYADLRLDKQAAWIRVRQEADKITMCFKQRQSETIDGMREIEFNIDNYDKACTFLEAIGLTAKAVQESKRETWQLDDCQIMLDEWPWIPAYVEVEGPDESAVRSASQKLGFQYAEAIFDSTDAIYQKYFDVTRTEISATSISFGPVPEWLEKRRKS